MVLSFLWLELTFGVEPLIGSHKSTVFVITTTRPYAVFPDSETDEAEDVVIVFALASCVFACLIVLVYIAAKRA